MRREYTKAQVVNVGAYGYPRRVLRHLYSLLFYLVVPVAVARLLWRSRAEPLYRATLGERFGFCRRVTRGGVVWVHAVSAGETNAAAPLIERLLAAGHPVMVTTMTPTGRGRVKALFGDRVFHAYAPYDLPGAVSRFIGRVRPRALIIIDTELWPNILHALDDRGIPVALVNARLSVRSAERYASISSMTKAMLDRLTIVACQTEEQGERFVGLGLDEDRLTVTGSIKFDASLPDDMDKRRKTMAKRFEGRRVILAASTHAGEEQAMLDALAGIEDEKALLVIAPRHPNRFREVAELCEQSGIAFTLHSTGDEPDRRTRVYLLDTMGELIYFYAAAELAFVGGSLVPVGGHNPMEPASVHIPVVMGRHLYNIEEIAARFRDAGGMRVVDSADALTAEIAALYHDADARAKMVAAADRVMDESRGALDETMELVTEMMVTNRRA